MIWAGGWYACNHDYRGSDQSWLILRFICVHGSVISQHPPTSQVPIGLSCCIMSLLRVIFGLLVTCYFARNNSWSWWCFHDILALTITSVWMLCHLYTVEDEAAVDPFRLFWKNSGREFCNVAGQKEPQWEDILLSHHFKCVQVVCIHTIFIILNFLEIVCVGRLVPVTCDNVTSSDNCASRLCQPVMTVIQSLRMWRISW